MAFDPNMVPAESGKRASSAEYNKMLNNVLEVHQTNQDQDSQISTLVSDTTSLDSRVTSLEGNPTPSERPILVARMDSANYETGGGEQLSFSIIESDTHGMWDSTNRRAVIPQPGLYELTLQLVFNGQSGGGPDNVATTSSTFGAYIMKNGTVGSSDSLCAFERLPHTGATTVFSTTGIAPLVSGSTPDYIYARAWADLDSSSYLRGVSSGSSYGGTYLVIRKIQDIP